MEPLFSVQGSFYAINKHRSIALRGTLHAVRASRVVEALSSAENRCEEQAGF